MTACPRWDRVGSAPELAEESRAGRAALLDNLPQVMEWAGEAGGDPFYIANVTALRTQDGTCVARTGAFVANGDWPLRRLREPSKDRMGMVVPNQPPRFTGNAAEVLLVLLARFDASMSEAPAIVAS